MEPSTQVGIIFGAILSFLLLLGLVMAVLSSRTRNGRQLPYRPFSRRPATPLDDAEFESWRRPSQAVFFSEKYGICPARTAVSEDRVSSELLQDLGAYESDLESRAELAGLANSPIGLVQKPPAARRKSSVASSLADQPILSYSPVSPSSDFLRGSVSSRASQPLIPRLSVSELSNFPAEVMSEWSRRGSRNWI